MSLSNVIERKQLVSIGAAGSRDGPGSTFPSNVCTSTHTTQYDLVSEGRRFTIHGALPIEATQPRDRSRVYSTGRDDLTLLR